MQNILAIYSLLLVRYILMNFFHALSILSAKNGCTSTDMPPTFLISSDIHLIHAKPYCKIFHLQQSKYYNNKSYFNKTTLTFLL